MEKTETIVYFKIKDWRGVKFPKLNYRLDYEINDRYFHYTENDRKLKLIRYNKMCKSAYGPYDLQQHLILEQCSLAFTDMQRIPQIGEKIRFPGYVLFYGNVFGYRKINTLEEFKSNVFPKLNGEKPMQYRQRLYDIIISYGENSNSSLGINSQFKSFMFEFQWRMNLCFTVVDLETNISYHDLDDYDNPGQLKLMKFILTLEVFEGVK